MAYIIENANLLKEKRLEQLSLLVKDDIFRSFRPSFKKFSYMRVDANPFIMTPSHVLYYPTIPTNEPFQSMKDFFLEAFIKKGCTMFLTYAEVEKESHLKSAIKKRKKELMNSPVDFTIGVKVPLEFITPSFIRQCKREKVPAIFIEVDAESELETVPWGWIREAMFPYNAPLIPIFTDEKPRQKKVTESRWTSILTDEKIPHIAGELQEHGTISYKNLCKIGIHPVKSGIHQGGEVSYNFYKKDVDTDFDSISEEELFQNHHHQLTVTVHKGTVIRAGSKSFFRSGFGEYVTIKTPSFFKLD